MAQEIKVTRKTDAPFTLVFKDTNSATIDITGSTISWIARENYDHDDTDNSEAVMHGIQGPSDLTDPTNGTTVFKLTSASLDINPEKYVGEITRVDGSGDTTRNGFDFIVKPNAEEG